MRDGERTWSQDRSIKIIFFKRNLYNIPTNLLSMKCNTGTIDRLIRVTIGTALLTSFYFMQDTYWLLVGIIPLLTGYVGFCPLYTMCKMDTCKVDPASKVEKK